MPGCEIPTISGVSHPLYSTGMSVDMERQEGGVTLYWAVDTTGVDTTEVDTTEVDTIWIWLALVNNTHKYIWTYEYNQLFCYVIFYMKIFYLFFSTFSLL